MTDTAKRLSGPSALTTSAVTQYTVPAATTTILRSIHVCNTGSGTGLFTLSIGTNAAGTQLFTASQINVGEVLDWSGFIVLNATNIIQALYSGNALTLTMSGVEIT